MTISIYPLGLVVVANLDTGSTILPDNYEDIVRYYLSLNCPESFDQRRAVCNVGTADEDLIKEFIN